MFFYDAFVFQRRVLLLLSTKVKKVSKFQVQISEIRYPIVVAHLIDSIVKCTMYIFTLSTTLHFITFGLEAEVSSM